jgi:hypothetical protein
VEENLAIWQEPFAAYLHEATGLGAWLKSWFVAPDLASKVARALAVFASEATPIRFAEFMNALFSFAKVSKVRVWMIVDEAPKYDSRFAILWPQEQAVDVFRFVLTGSVGIANFTTKQGLSQRTWDVPVFTPVEVGAFALKLADALDLDRKVLVDAFGLFDRRRGDNSGVAAWGAAGGALWWGAWPHGGVPAGDEERPNLGGVCTEVEGRWQGRRRLGHDEGHKG